MREIYINGRLLRCCYTFISGNVFWASGIPPSLYSLPTQPSSFYKKYKTEREKQKETFMAHHPSQFMILFLLLSL